MYGPPPQGQGPNMQPLQSLPAGRKRSNDEPHTPTMPPPNPADQAQLQRGSQQYAYPDPSGLNHAGASPASSVTSFHSAQPLYMQQPARVSPQSALPYEASRASSSPHPQGGLPSAPAAPTSFAPQSGMQYWGGTPSPGGMVAVNAAHPGVKISDIVAYSGAQQQHQQPPYQQQVAQQAVAHGDERTRMDTSMVQALNRGPM
ncbi:hypothetical protein BAUCODRAFT_36098 [Baudoinia panamericana UAMH 10762]|uniref:Uncharacterized protein n=1 Tax=Baudoinia panamericana (strain UAMH 10762) TaxID=717646 RepID=M2ME30_BAUPA|nr:uncharacterized protein BAUCODRAFT_36098 [Baudoinia panamericana UAMH 10762]EMC94836.1 hypothetical protein BAUCODRAFT_36098 [Baudoinia panamericana UAMH 10762]